MLSECLGRGWQCGKHAGHDSKRVLCPLAVIIHKPRGLELSKQLELVGITHRLLMYAGHFDDPSPAYTPTGARAATPPGTSLWPLGLYVLALMLLLLSPQSVFDRSSKGNGKRRAPAAARHFSTQSIDRYALWAVNPRIVIDGITSPVCSLATAGGDVEKTVFTYTLTAGTTEIHFIISCVVSCECSPAKLTSRLRSVEPAPDHAPQQYILFLSLKTG